MPAPEASPRPTLAPADTQPAGDKRSSGGPPTKGLFRTGWLVGPRYDLVFFIGSGTATLLFYGIYRLAIHWGYPVNAESVLITYFIFTAVFDHPHIFQTFSRTHYDADEFAKRRILYTWGLAAFIAMGLILTALNFTGYLIVFASIFGSWHIIRQHSGFLKAYKVRNGDTLPLDNLLDSAVFYTGMFACFFNDYSEPAGMTNVYGKLAVRFPNLPVETGEVLWDLFLVLLFLFFLRQIQRVRRGEGVNLPKLLLMTSAIGVHYFVYFATATPFLVAEALETASHNVQYQGWIMHYQKKRFPGVRRVALKWFLVSMAYGIVVGVVEIFGLLDQAWAVWLMVPFAMVVLFHYFVDGLVWRFRHYPELGRLLFSRSGS